MCEMLSNLFANRFGKSEENSGNANPRQLMCVEGRLIFVWHAKQGLSAFVIAEKVHSNTHDVPIETVVNLSLTYCVCHDVSSVELSTSAAYLSLAGPSGVTIVHLPRRLFNLNQPIESSITCRSCPVDASLFEHNPSLFCCKQRWLPNMDVLFLLYSDNILRCYDVSQCSTGVISCCTSTSFNEDHSQTANYTSRTFKMSLGEIAVSFAIGAQLNSVQSVTLFILFGNGHVRSVCFSGSQLTFVGPTFDVLMQPETRDNYGCDACDALFLNAHIPILAIADSSATIHLCIVLYEYTETCIESATLHVYESIQMERALSHVDLETSKVVNDMNTSQLLLLPHPRLPSSLLCCHVAGVHSISLNWVSQLATTRTHKASGSSQAQYIFCSKPVHSSKPSYAQGFVCVDCGYHQVAVALLPDHSVCLIPLNFESSLHSDSPLKEKESSEIGVSFIVYIKSILQRTSSNPIVKGDDKCMNEKEMAQLVNRCCHTLNKEHIRKLMLAKKACMDSHRELQTQDVMQVEQRIYEAAQSLLSLRCRLDQICDFQSNIQLRLADLNASLNKGPLSPAEEKLLEDLRIMDNALQALNTRLHQLKLTVKQMNSVSNASNTPKLNSDEVNSFFKILDHQQAQLQALVDTISSAGRAQL